MWPVGLSGWPQEHRWPPACQVRPAAQGSSPRRSCLCGHPFIPYVHTHADLLGRIPQKASPRPRRMVEATARVTAQMTRGVWRNTGARHMPVGQALRPSVCDQLNKAHHHSCRPLIDNKDVQAVLPSSPRGPPQSRSPGSPQCSPAAPGFTRTQCHLPSVPARPRAQPAVTWWDPTSPLTPGSFLGSQTPPQPFQVGLPLGELAPHP